MAQQQVCSLPQRIPVPAVTVDVISDPDAFREYGDKWDRLVADSGIRHPFASHAWLTTWWEHFGAGKTLQVFVARRGRDWLGAAPMMMHTVNMYGVPVRRLDSIYNYHVPRNEFPVVEQTDDVYEGLWQAISCKDAPWDAVVLQQFLSDSQTLARFRRLAGRNGWLAGDWAAAPSPYIELGCSYDDVVKRLSHNMRQNLRKRQAKLAEVDTVDIETVSDPSEIPLAIADGFRIEAAAWKGTAGTAIISDPQVERFYARLASRAAELGWVKLIFLRVGGKRIAFNYVLEVAGVLYGLKIGYDPDYQSYSPGNMLRSLLLKEACERGCLEYDFLGNPDEWKLAWTRETRLHGWLFLFRKRPLARMVYHAKFDLIPAVRRSPRLIKLTNSLLGLVQCSQSND